MEYKFDRYDHMERLERVRGWEYPVILVTKEKAIPYAIFGINGQNRQECAPLCIAGTGGELNWKLIKIHQELEKDGIKYKLDKRIEE